MSYFVKVGFDEVERRYFVLHSDVPGLNIEADNIEDFVEAAQGLIGELVELPQGAPTIRFEREVGLVS